MTEQLNRPRSSASLPYFDATAWSSIVWPGGCHACRPGGLPPMKCAGPSAMNSSWHANPSEHDQESRVVFKLPCSAGAVAEGIFHSVLVDTPALVQTRRAQGVEGTCTANELSRSHR
eukprot:jgi/Ulvmu1/9541/UM053_0030.1